MQTLQTTRQGKSGSNFPVTIYSGTIAHLCGQKIAVKKDESSQASAFISTDHYYKKLFADFLLSKDEFLKDKKGRELFSVSEIAEFMGVSATRLTRHMDDKYLAVFRGAKIYIKSFASTQKYGNAVSLKNHAMWASATIKECNAHLDKYRG